MLLVRDVTNSGDIVEIGSGGGRIVRRSGSGSGNMSY